MSKKINYQTRIDPDNIPVPKKKTASSRKKKEKLGLLSNPDETYLVGFRINKQVLGVFNNKCMELRSQSGIRLNKVAVLEMLIMYAKDVSFQELADAYKKNMENS